MPNLATKLSLGLTAVASAVAALATTHLATPAASAPARSPERLAALLARYDAGETDLADEIDRTAAQRHAAASRLYWYTDWDSAAAEARARHVPVLELRMLGHLDEDLSCANSRIFRAAVYSNAETAAFLRAHFVLYWSSVRPVPKLTIDLGDGRELRTTITGNSAHYIRDADGTVLDVLPGVYAPVAFHTELGRALALFESLTPKDKLAQIRRYHADAAQRLAASWQSDLPLLTRDVVKMPMAYQAQRLTVSKAYIERPMLGQFQSGPQTLPDDETAAWARIGEATWRGRAPVLDRSARALVIALHQAGPVKATVAEVEALLARFGQHLLADSALDEFKLHARIHTKLAAGPVAFADLDRWLYADVFRTPLDDRWMGLLPRTDVTGLPGDGASAP